jgi:hypothetical protein
MPAYYGPYIGFGSAIGAVPAEFNSGAFIDTNQLIPYSAADLEAAGYSGVYSGSLSSQGNMVAMQLNNGSLNYVVVATDPATGEATNVVIRPYLTGYFRQYTKDPRQCIFGANSAIPAITGVMPTKYSATPGNLLYYMDIQMTRLTGSNTFNSKYFINAFNQALGWVVTSNGYISSLNNAQNTNLAYHGAHDTAQLITTGFDVLAKSNAVKLALKNQGTMVQSIVNGNFGTPNAVAQTLIEAGLGTINNLSTTLLQNGVTLQNIASNNYTAVISETLANITSTSDLDTIQYVINSSIPNIASALDYVSIEKSSGIANDSTYTSMANIGTVLYKRGPISTFTTGTQIYNFLSNLQYTVPPSVDNIATQTSMLRPDIIDSLRSYLPISANNQPISIVNVVGMASGYLTDYIQLVNEGLAALAATDYGSQISTTLSTISRYDAKIPADSAEAAAANSYTPVPPGVYSTDEEGNTFTIQAPGPDYYQVKSEQYQTEYYNILANIVADPDNGIRSIVKQINDNYDIVCSQTSLEYQNWMKANLQISDYGDNSIFFSFVSSLPGFGADRENLGTDLTLYGMVQNNDAGDLAKVILEQAKNAVILSNVNVRVLGVL